MEQKQRAELVRSIRKDRRARRQVAEVNAAYNARNPTARQRQLETVISNSGRLKLEEARRETGPGPGQRGNPVNDLMDERIIPFLRTRRRRR